MATKRAVGRPPKYKTKEEIEEKIELYFKQCEGEVLKDNNGEMIFDKFGRPIVLNVKPPTVTGLALALGFTTRQALLNYQGKKEFVDTITRAKSLVEQYTEERLFDRDGASGAQFSLRNNFSGWNQDKQVTELDRKEQEARIEQLNARTEQIKGAEQNSTEDKVRKLFEAIGGALDD